MSVVRAVLAMVLVFAVLAALRALRLAIAAWRAAWRRPRRLPPKEGELARDPVCGSWFDRRLAVAAHPAGQALAVEVCSDGCRRRLEGR